MIKHIKGIARFFKIAWVFARHDALFLLEPLQISPFVTTITRLVRKRSTKRPGERLADALTDLGPSFIKFGQALSVRSDLVGLEVAEDLSRLQDRLAPFDFKEVEKAIQEDFGVPWPSLFLNLDPQPIAAASVAQVHFAITTDNREVAVKVLRPHIAQKLAKDIEFFYWVADFITKTQPSFRHLRLHEAVQVFEQTVQCEIDMRLEAAAAQELGENFRGCSYYRTPKVDWDRTNRRILTTERVKGVAIGDVVGLRAAGLDLRQVLKHSSNAFFYQVFRDGFFHADMHGGNAFVDAKGTIVPVDFGIMGRLSEEDRLFLGRLLLAILKGDYRRVADLHFEANLLPPETSRDEFAQACRALLAPIAGKPSRDISLAHLLGQILNLTQRFQIKPQPQLFLLHKTMLMAEGMGCLLDPSANLWEISAPLIEKWMREQFGPKAQAKQILQAIKSFVADLPKAVEVLQHWLQEQENKYERSKR